MLVFAGVAIGIVLPMPGIWYRFIWVLCALPLLAVADVLLLHSGRGFSFWLRACGFEICTVFGVAALIRVALDARGLAPLLPPA